MKIIAALAALPLAALPVQCEPSTQPAPAAVPAHRSAYGVSLDAQAACAVFTARIWNNNNAPRTARIRVDGYEQAILYAPSQSSDEDTIYFTNNSGDHTVSVFWAGGTSTYTIWTNCGP